MRFASSSWTGRAPRTMAEAFNPHCDNRLQPMPDRRKTPAHEVALYIVSVLALAVLAALPFLER